MTAANEGTPRVGRGRRGEGIGVQEMVVVWTILGALIGSLIGAALGFGAALLAASPRGDGTFGFREIAVGLPAGIVLGLVVGALLAHRLAA